MKKEFKFEDENLIPDWFKFNGKYHKIIKIKSKHFIIGEFSIVTEDNRLKELFLYNCFHPNAIDSKTKKIISLTPPKKLKFCLPTNWIDNLIITDENIDEKIYLFRDLITKYNLDNSYYMPWKYIVY